jgi:uncharacterized membrane protein YeaQ/YmgE (transglycosylase-associated protein family)
MCKNTLFLEAIPEVEEWLFRIVREAIMLHPFYDLNRVINGHRERTPFFVAPATVIGKVQLSSLYWFERRIAMLVLASVLDPGGLLAWLIVGLIAGFLASALMRSGGYGLIGDIVIGIVGAFIGGLLVDVLAPGDSFGFWGSVLVALIGACILIAVLRAVSRRGFGRVWCFYRSIRRI